MFRSRVVMLFIAVWMLAFAPERGIAEATVWDAAGPEAGNHQDITARPAVADTGAPENENLSNQLPVVPPPVFKPPLQPAVAASQAPPSKNQADMIPPKTTVTVQVDNGREDQSRFRQPGQGAMQPVLPPNPLTKPAIAPGTQKPSMAPSVNSALKQGAAPGPMRSSSGPQAGIPQAGQVKTPPGAPVPIRPQAPPVTAPPQLLPPQAPPVTSVMEAGKKMFNLNFDDADVYSIIHTVFADVLRVNYVIDSRIKGRASFKSVSRIPQENVLAIMEVILRLNGIAVVEDENLYRILPISEIAREPSPVAYGRDEKSIAVKGKALLQVIPINHIQSSEMVRLVSPFLSANASVVDIPKINGIVIVDTDTNVKRILKLIDIFDSELQKRKGPQVYVYPVQHSKAKDVANLLQQIFLNGKQGGNVPRPSVSQKTPSNQPASGSSRAAVPPPTASTRNVSYAPPSQPQISMGLGGDSLVSDIVKIFYDEVINSIIVLGTMEDYEIIKDTIKKVDIAPRQVLIEGMIAEVSLTDKLSLGLRWALNAKAFGTDFSVTLNKSNAEKTSGLDIIGTDSSGNIQAMISALATESKAKLLASPHVMVSDNREARIQVGQSVPIPTSETYGAVGVVPQRTIQYKDIGIILKVKPQISDSGQVTIDLSQEVSTYSTIPLYSNELQIILNKTDATTSLVVQDGQTIIIGGLIREDRMGSKAGIPFLSKIPVIGYLFGNTDKEDTRKEMVILLTPRVVKNQKTASSITSEFVDKFTQTGTKKDIKKQDLIYKNEPVSSSVK